MRNHGDAPGGQQLRTFEICPHESEGTRRPCSFTCVDRKNFTTFSGIDRLSTCISNMLSDSCSNLKYELDT